MSVFRSQPGPVSPLHKSAGQAARGVGRSAQDSLRDPSDASGIFAKPVTILTDLPSPSEPIGLIGGGGGLPKIIAKNLRSAGYVVHGLGLAGQYDADLPNLCSSFRDIGVLRVGSWGKLLSRQGVHHAIMVGKVDKARLMHDPLRMLKHTPDWRTIALWYRYLRKDRRSHALMKAVAEELERWGVTLLDSTAPIPDEMSHLGQITKLKATGDQIGDVQWAWPKMATLLRLDIGQSIAVRECDIIAVEAVEGTDRMIERAGRLCRAKGWTLIKAARLGHDRRADVPTVGTNTIRMLHAAGAGCLALTAGEVIMLEKDEMIRLAEKLGIAIIGIEPLHDVQDHIAGRIELKPDGRPRIG